jgi:hypothetical protein
MEIQESPLNSHNSQEVEQSDPAKKHDNHLDHDSSVFFD